MENKSQNHSSSASKIKILGQFLCPNLIKENCVYPEIVFEPSAKIYRN